MPLNITSALANTDEDIASNIDSALRRDYIPFNDLLGKKSGAVAIVGSGPSLKDMWKRLRKFKGDIIACNAACQFLLDKGIVPTYAYCFDADPLMLEFITAHQDITYLMASRCPPEAFDGLQGCKIVCWHAKGDRDIQELLEKHGLMEPMVTGGSAAVTRAMVLAMPMGYKDVHIFGGDSSFHNGDTHIRKSTTKERRMHIMCGERIFECAPWMAVQAEDFKVLAPIMVDKLGVKLHVHGDGIIPHIAMAIGLDVDRPLRVRRFVMNWKRNAKTLWHHI